MHSNIKSSQTPEKHTHNSPFTFISNPKKLYIPPFANTYALVQKVISLVLDLGWDEVRVDVALCVKQFEEVDREVREDTFRWRTELNELGHLVLIVSARLREIWGLLEFSDHVVLAPLVINVQFLNFRLSQSLFGLYEHSQILVLL